MLPRRPSNTRLRALAMAHASARERLAASAAATAQREARSFTGWYDTAAITVMTLRLATLIEAAQRQTAAVTDAYLVRALAEMLGRPIRPIGPVDITGLRQGVTHPGVYGRLADLYRYERSRGLSEPEVLQVVVQRAETLARTDTDLAFRAQAHAYTADPQKLGITGYRRVLHPELSAGGTCGLCIVASDRTYYKDRLMPLHDRCHCGVLPIIGDLDPGKNLNGEDLAALYKRAGSTAAADLKRVRIAVHEHSEIGPVLRNADDSFRDAHDVAISTTH